MIRLTMNRDGELFTGSVDNIHFTSIALEKVLVILADAVRGSGDKEVLYCTKKVEIPMPVGDIELLLAEPQTLLRKLAPPPVVVDLRRGKKSSLVVGYDTLANGFGEEIYCRRNGEKFECPGCGRWSGVTPCSSCGIDLTITKRNDRWFSIPISDLLRSSRDRFFTPRGWNNNRPWISRSDLENRYQAFTKEKAHV